MLATTCTLARATDGGKGKGAIATASRSNPKKLNQRTPRPSQGPLLVKPVQCCLQCLTRISQTLWLLCVLQSSSRILQQPPRLITGNLLEDLPGILIPSCLILLLSPSPSFHPQRLAHSPLHRFPLSAHLPLKHPLHLHLSESVLPQSLARRKPDDYREPLVRRSLPVISAEVCRILHFHNFLY